MLYKKIKYIVIFLMIACQGSSSVACEFKTGMGRALDVLSRLDRAYQSNLKRIDLPQSINTLILTGTYPGKLPGFPETVTGGINLTRVANAQEACLISKAVIRTAVFASDSAKGYDTLEHYQRAFQEYVAKPDASPIILQHLKIVILTAELAIVKNRSIFFSKTRGFHHKKLGERKGRLERKAIHRKRCMPGSPHCVEPFREHHHHRHAYLDLIGETTRIYQKQNNILFAFNDDWMKMLASVAQGLTFNQAFAIVAVDHGG